MMNRSAVAVTGLMMVGLLLSLGCGPESIDLPAPEVFGRWDLTLTSDTESLPAWLELTPGATPTGRYQPPGGHALEVDSLRIVGTEVEFRIPQRRLHFTGSFADATVSGTVVDRVQGPFEVAGGRAPSLERTEAPVWEEELDLLAEGLEGWRVRDERNGWSYDNGELINTLPSSDLISLTTYTDFRLHVEVNVPDGGNSGIYLRGRHEVQVQDDFGNAPHSQRMGGIYGQVTPTVLPSKPAGEWQVFEITLIGRRVTVVLNGVTMIDTAEIPGITGGALDSDEGSPGPIMLQGDHSDVRYRNIRITPARD